MSADTGTRLLVVRHGETDWNAQRRVQGHTDIALNDTGKRQASLLARALADSPIHHVYSSDLQRARQTAQTLAGPHDALHMSLPGCANAASAALKDRFLPTSSSGIPKQPFIGARARRTGSRRVAGSHCWHCAIASSVL